MLKKRHHMKKKIAWKNPRLNKVHSSKIVEADISCSLGAQQSQGSGDACSRGSGDSTTCGLGYYAVACSGGEGLGTWS